VCWTRLSAGRDGHTLLQASWHAYGWQRGLGAVGVRKAVAAPAGSSPMCGKLRPLVRCILLAGSTAGITCCALKAAAALLSWDAAGAADVQGAGVFKR
jgi:hypothetical protein